MARSVSTPAVAPANRIPSATALVVGLGVLPLLVFAAIALFELANWDKVTPGVPRLLDRPLDIHGGDQTWHTTARDLGLRLDPNELVGAAYLVGRQGGP